MTSPFIHIFIGAFVPILWAYRHHFYIEDDDDEHATLDCGVEVKFEQSNHVSHHDKNVIEGKLGYIGKI